MAALCRWYINSGAGQLLYQEEAAQLQAVLPGLFGYHLLQIGCYGSEDLLDASRINHRMIMSPHLPRDATRPVLLGSADAIPLASESLDVVVMPHTLDYDDNPHGILREIDRVLIAEGHVVILSFNPFSLFGLWRLFAGWRGHPPWCGRFVTGFRVRDWLSLLGFDIVSSRCLFYRPPLNHERVMDKLRFIDHAGQRVLRPFGAVYMIVARKRVSTLTPIGPRWQTTRKLVTAEAGPSTRQQT